MLLLTELAAQHAEAACCSGKHQMMKHDWLIKKDEETWRFYIFFLKRARRTRNSKCHFSIGTSGRYEISSIPQIQNCSFCRLPSIIYLHDFASSSIFACSRVVQLKRENCQVHCTFFQMRWVIPYKPYPDTHILLAQDRKRVGVKWSRLFLNSSHPTSIYCYPIHHFRGQYS